MSNPFTILKPRHEERWLFLAVVIIFAALNAMLIYSHWDFYTRPLPHGGSWSIFHSRFEMSGYDCWSLMTISEGRVFFETIRHPLFYSFLYPLWKLNKWLMSITGLNCAMFIMSAVTVLCAAWSALFLYRILHELLDMRKADAALLTAMFFSFGHVMVPAMVPDHFIMSLMLLTMTIYIYGRKMQQKRLLTTLQTAVMLFLTSGIAASNGMKTLLAALFVNGKRVFRPSYIFLAVVMPLVTLLAIQRCQYHTVEEPQKAEIHKIEKANESKITDADRQRMAEHHKQIVNTEMKSAGSGILAMMDFQTQRKDILCENFFGEAILLHSDHALGDIVSHRPVVTYYHHWWAYAIEIFFFVAFIAGAWTGRRNKIVQMLLCWFAVDVMLNIVLGFAINELYLMASGWIFIIPVCMTFLMRKLPQKQMSAAEVLLVFLTVFLFTHNALLIYHHLYG